MRKLALLCLAGSLAGCVNLAPAHVRPEMPTANEYPAEFAHDEVPGQRAAEIGWRDFFVDARLEGLVGQALVHNRDLAVAVAQIDEARGLYRIQRADRLPSITANADATRGRAMREDNPETGNTLSTGISITSFELDFWGRVKNLSEATRREYLATQEAERAFRLALIRDVASTYFTSREAEERITLAQATMESRHDALRIAQRRLDAGVTSALDYRQAESLLTQAETDLAGLKLAKAQSDNFLAVLTGGPATTPLPPSTPLSQQMAMPTLAVGLPSDLLVARPDIVAAEERLRAARANIGAARAAFFPSISLTGNAGFASTELGSLFESDGFTWSFGPAIRLPIFDGGRNKANLTVAEARENMAVARYEFAIQNAFREVADALAGRKYYAEQVASQERGVEATRRIARLAQLRYREGVASYIEVLDAERNSFTAEQTLVQLRRAQAENLVSLYVALGGGLI